MSRKFLGLAVLAVMTGFISLVSIPTVSHDNAEAAGFFRRLFGIQSDCGGGLQSYSASCGGGGLQYATYSSCSGGGLQSVPYASCSGGGGLQFAPASTYYYTPSYAPASYYYAPASSCPGGVCPPGAGGGLSYAPTYYAPTYAVAPSVPIQLNPGERYVAGSLREVQATPAKTQIAKATPKKTPSVPEDLTVYQITQDGCHPCEQDAQLARQAGVKLTILNMNVVEDAFKVASLWSKTGEQLPGTPAYIVMKGEEPVVWKTSAIGSAEGFVSMTKAINKVYKPEIASVKKEEPSPSNETNEKLDRIEAAILQLATEIRESRKTETRTAALN